MLRGPPGSTVTYPSFPYTTLFRSDFSSRWLASAGELSSIRTTAILPVDLNSYLYKLEMQIARLSDAGGDEPTAVRFDKLAHARQEAIDRKSTRLNSSH